MVRVVPVRWPQRCPKMLALRQSRFKRAINLMGISLGHAASHSPWRPKPLSGLGDSCRAPMERYAPWNSAALRRCYVAVAPPLPAPERA